MEPMRKQVDVEAREAVAAEVRSLMGRHRTSQVKLGLAIGLGQSAMSDRLKAKTAFDLDEIIAIARYFDVPVSTLLPNEWITLPPKSDLYVVQGETGVVALSFDDIDWCSGSPRGSHLSVV